MNTLICEICNKRKSIRDFPSYFQVQWCNDCRKIYSKCGKCNQIKLITEFSPSQRFTGSGWCRKCRKEYDANKPKRIVYTYKH